MFSWLKKAFMKTTYFPDMPEVKKSKFDLLKENELKRKANVLSQEQKTFQRLKQKRKNKK